MKMRKMRILNLSLTLLWVATSFGQSHKASITEIHRDGLYKILLPAELRAASANNFDYLRIKDDQNQEVPYVIMAASDRQYSTFKSLTIASKTVYPDSVTSLIIENEAQLKDNLVLKIANTTIDKYFTLYGSDDKEEWFGLIAENRLALNGSNSATSLEKNISIPLNNYRYLRLDFDDKNSISINVLEIGIYENQYFPSKMLTLNNFTQSLTNSSADKLTKIAFKSRASHKVDAISFKIGTEFYRRSADIMVEKKNMVKKKMVSYEESLSNFTLSSTGSNSISFHDLYLSDFTLQIANQDNPPLEIESITFYQKPKYLVSYLKAGQSYQVEVDDELGHPSYDLAYFISNNINDLQEADISSLEQLSNPEEGSEDSRPKSFWESKMFMWLAIGIGGLLVLYFAVSMLRDMSKS
jgi:hypothetical protein